MGGSSCKFDDEMKKIAVLGLFGAGKSSLVYRLTFGERVKDFYGLGLDIQTIKRDDETLAVWDYQGRHDDRLLYRLQCIQSSGVIYMMDSTEPSRFERSLDCLSGIFEDEKLTDITVMVVANKQDLDDALGPEVIEEEIKKNCKIGPGFTVFVMPMSVMAEDDHSMQLALRLFIKTMRRKDAGKVKSGLIPRAWETAEKDAEDSAEEQDEVTDEKDMKKKKGKNRKKSIFKDSIHMFKSLLIR